MPLAIRFHELDDLTSPPDLEVYDQPVLPTRIPHAARSEWR